MGTKKANMFFAEIGADSVGEYTATMRSTLNLGARKENFIEMNDEKFYCRIKTDGDFDLIKFYKLRSDFNPVVLNEDGDDSEFELSEGSFAEVAYFLVYKTHVVILRTGYSPSILYFQRYLQKLYEKKKETNFPAILSTEIIDLYDKDVIDKINRFGISKFYLNLKVLNFANIIGDEIDMFFKDPLDRAISNHVVTLSIGMRKQNGSFSNAIKNSIFKLTNFASKAKAVTLENNRKVEYNLLHHKIRYSKQFSSSVHVEYESLLHEAINWLLTRE